MSHRGTIRHADYSTVRFPIERCPIFFSAVVWCVSLLIWDQNQKALIRIGKMALPENNDNEHRSVLSSSSDASGRNWFDEFQERCIRTFEGVRPDHVDHARNVDQIFGTRVPVESTPESAFRKAFSENMDEKFYERYKATMAYMKELLPRHTRQNLYQQVLIVRRLHPTGTLHLRMNPLLDKEVINAMSKMYEISAWNDVTTFQEHIYSFVYVDFALHYIQDVCREFWNQTPDFTSLAKIVLSQPSQRLVFISLKFALLAICDKSALSLLIEGMKSGKSTWYSDITDAGNDDVCIGLVEAEIVKFVQLHELVRMTQDNDKILQFNLVLWRCLYRIKRCKSKKGGKKRSHEEMQSMLFDGDAPFDMLALRDDRSISAVSVITVGTGLGSRSYQSDVRDSDTTFDFANKCSHGKVSFGAGFENREDELVGGTDTTAQGASFDDLCNDEEEESGVKMVDRTDKTTNGTAFDGSPYDEEEEEFGEELVDRTDTTTQGAPFDASVNDEEEFGGLSEGAIETSSFQDADENEEELGSLAGEVMDMSVDPEQRNHDRDTRLDMVEGGDVIGQVFAHFAGQTGARAFNGPLGEVEIALRMFVTEYGESTAVEKDSLLQGIYRVVRLIREKRVASTRHT